MDLELDKLSMEIDVIYNATMESYYHAKANVIYETYSEFSYNFAYESDDEHQTTWQRVKAGFAKFIKMVKGWIRSFFNLFTKHKKDYYRKIKFCIKTLNDHASDIADNAEVLEKLMSIKDIIDAGLSNIEHGISD